MKEAMNKKKAFCMTLHMHNMATPYKCGGGVLHLHFFRHSSYYLILVGNDGALCVMHIMEKRGTPPSGGWEKWNSFKYINGEYCFVIFNLPCNFFRH